MVVRQDSKKPRKFLGKWNGETETDSWFKWPHPAPWPTSLLLPCTIIPLSTKPPGQWGSDQHQTTLGTKPPSVLTSETKFWSSQRKHLGLSCVSAPVPEKQQNQIRRCHSWHQNQMPWPMTPYPSPNQSVETYMFILMNQHIKGHTWNVDEYFIEYFIYPPLRCPLKFPPWENK